jgi:glycosyltransferase involved in cell wall biosynthesis
VPPARAAAIRAIYGIGADEPFALFIERMTQVKGVQPLVEGMREVVARVPNVRLVILGRGELEEPVLRRVSELGLERNVLLRYEFVNEEERIAHYAACDLAVFPSTYEPFGIVSLEAMSMSKPAVVGARGVVGFREQVLANGPDQTGLHVDGRSSGDIAWGLTEALSDQARLRRWGANGRRRVLSSFTWEHAARKTLDVYRRVAGRGDSTGVTRSATQRVAL